MVTNHLRPSWDDPTQVRDNGGQKNPSITWNLFKVIYFDIFYFQPW